MGALDARVVSFGGSAAMAFAGGHGGPEGSFVGRYRLSGLAMRMLKRRAGAGLQQASYAAVDAGSRT